MNREFPFTAHKHICRSLTIPIMGLKARGKSVMHLTDVFFFSYVFAKFQTNLVDVETSKKNDHPETQTIPTFVTLYIFAFLFQLLLVFDALRAKNTIQVIGLCMFNAALLLYAGIQLTQIQDAIDSLEKQRMINVGVWSSVKPYLIAVPCIIALGFFLMSVAAWKLYDEFAWTIYKEISADLKMKRRYLTYQVGVQMEYQALLLC